MSQMTTENMHPANRGALPRFIIAALLMLVLAPYTRAGDLTIDGNLAVTSNLTVNGNVTGITAAKVGAVATNDARYVGALTNAAAFDPAGAAAAVQSSMPLAISNNVATALTSVGVLGDLSMGTFTNRNQ